METKSKTENQAEFNRYDIRGEEPHEFETQEDAFRILFNMARFPVSVVELEAAGLMRETIAHFETLGLVKINEEKRTVQLSYAGLGYFETRRFLELEAQKREQKAQKRNTKVFWRNVIVNFVVTVAAMTAVELIMRLF